MKKFTSMVLGTALLLGLTNSAYSHAVSIGYENAGAGSVTIWLGTYSIGHAAPVNEGSLNLVGVMGNSFPSTTVAFSLLVGQGVGSGTIADKPAGLVDGTSNFYIPNTSTAAAPLVASEAGFNAACPTCGPVNHWQGVTFTGLGAGKYQFTYIPIALPTAQWDILDPSMNGIFDLTAVIQPPPNGVPDGGASVAMLGFALVGMVGFSRTRKLVTA